MMKVHNKIYLISYVNGIYWKYLFIYEFNK